MVWSGDIVSLEVTFQHNTTARMLEGKSCLIRLTFKFWPLADQSYTVYLYHLLLDRVTLDQSVAFEDNSAELKQG